MAGVLGRIEVRARCQFLGHARHIDAAQAARLDLPVAIDGAEKGTGQLLPSTLEWCGSFALVCPSRPVLPDLLIFHWGRWGHWARPIFIGRNVTPLEMELPVLRQNMTRLICGHVQVLEERLREVATEHVAPRVARQLIRLQEQVGSPQKGLVEIGLSREGLAQMTGTTLYTVSRLLSTWEEHGLVTCRRESMMISDIRALRKVFEAN
jgi:hypothetical protein